MELTKEEKEAMMEIANKPTDKKMEWWKRHFGGMPNGWEERALPAPSPDPSPTEEGQRVGVRSMWNCNFASLVHLGGNM